MDTSTTALGALVLGKVGCEPMLVYFFDSEIVSSLKIFAATRLGFGVVGVVGMVPGAGIRTQLHPESDARELLEAGRQVFMAGMFRAGIDIGEVAQA